MLSRKAITMPRSMVLAFALAVCGCAEAVPPPQSVEGVRPVARAVEKLEATYLVPITYEDIRYVYAGEMKTDEQGRSIIKGGSVSFTLNRVPEGATIRDREALAAKSVAEAVQSYNAARGKQMFAVVGGNDDALHVVPLQTTNASGMIEMQKPILDIPVSIQPGQKTSTQVIDEIVKAVSDATGRKLDVGVLVPRAAFRHHQTDITAVNEPARSVLARLLKEIPVGYESKPNKAGGTHLIRSALSWQLFCGPNDNPECSLNIHVVTPEGRSPAALEDAPQEAIRPEDQ